jgi:hypothetical protein
MNVWAVKFGIMLLCVILNLLFQAHLTNLLSSPEGSAAAFTKNVDVV